MWRPQRRDRVFISYRRADSAGHAGRLNDDLTRLLGRRVFMDLVNIGAGAKFDSVILRELSTCGVVLAVIGPRWLAALSERSADEDYVQTELAAALTETGIDVIPVLLQGAQLPSPTELPEALKSLATRQALVIRDDRWKNDVDNLAQALRTSLKLRRIPIWLVVLGGAVAIVLGLWVGVGRVPDPPGFGRGDGACHQFAAFAEYSWKLADAYHTRASLNRWAIYGAVTMVLVTFATTGGLLVAGVSRLTVGLLLVLGVAGSVAYVLLSDDTLAMVYTIKANEVVDDVNRSQSKSYGPDGLPTPSSCVSALTFLNEAVTAARRDLERARTDSAYAALIRAEATRRSLQQLQDMLREANPEGMPKRPAEAR